MFMSTDVFLKRIFYTLEHVIAPEVDDDFARGQVFAVISLLEQLASHVEFKRDLIEKDIRMGVKVLEGVLEALGEAGVEPPEELAEYMEGLDSMPVNLRARDRMEEMISLAVELLHDNASRLDAARAGELDRMVRDYITKIATRDLGLLKPPRIDQISRPQKKGA